MMRASALTLTCLLGFKDVNDYYDVDVDVDNGEDNCDYKNE